MFNLGDSQGVPLVVNKISMVSLTCNLIIGGAYCWKVPGNVSIHCQPSQPSQSSKNLDSCSIFPKHVKDLSLSILIPPKVPLLPLSIFISTNAKWGSMKGCSFTTNKRIKVSIIIPINFIYHHHPQSWQKKKTLQTNSTVYKTTWFTVTEFIRI